MFTKGFTKIAVSEPGKERFFPDEPLPPKHIKKKPLKMRYDDKDPIREDQYKQNLHYEM